MKKLLALICVMFLVAVAAKADAPYNGNGSQSDNSYFTTTVIQPLSMAIPQGGDLKLPSVVPLFPRSFSPPRYLTFTIEGTPNEVIEVTTYEPTSTGSGVTISGEWTTKPTKIELDGTATIKWGCVGVSATGSASHGKHVFELKIDVKYTSI